MGALDKYYNFTGGANEAITGLLGAPVDLVNRYTVRTQQPVMGSNWLRQKFNQAGIGTQGKGVAGLLGSMSVPAGKVAGLLEASAQMANAKTPQQALLGGATALGGEWLGGLLGRQNPDVISSMAARIRKGEDVGEAVFPDAQVVSYWSKQDGGPSMLADDMDAVVEEIQRQMAASKGRYGLRVDEASRGLKAGDTIPKSKKWVDGVETDKFLSGTSVVKIKDASAESIRAALKILGIPPDPRRGYYPGSQVSLVKNGSSK